MSYPLNIFPVQHHLAVSSTGVSSHEILLKQKVRKQNFIPPIYFFLFTVPSLYSVSEKRHHSGLNQDPSCTEPCSLQTLLFLYLATLLVVFLTLYMLPGINIIGISVYDSKNVTS